MWRMSCNPFAKMWWAKRPTLSSLKNLPSYFQTSSNLFKPSCNVNQGHNTPTSNQPPRHSCLPEIKNLFTPTMSPKTSIQFCLSDFGASKGTTVVQEADLETWWGEAIKQKPAGLPIYRQQWIIVKMWVGVRNYMKTQERESVCELFLWGKSDLIAHFPVVQDGVWLWRPNLASQHTDFPDY